LTEKPNKDKLTLKSVAKPLIVIAIIAGGIFGTYFAITSYLGSETPIVIVTSESMHDVYFEGDILFVKHVSVEEIEVGMDIVFHADWIPPTDPNYGIPVVHRVIEKQYIDGEWWFTTQGVNEETNPYPDPAPTPYSNVIGIVVFVIPRIGLPLLAIRSTIGVYGLQIFIGILIILIVAYIAYDHYSSNKEQQEKQSTEEKKKSLWTEEDFKETEKEQEKNDKENEENPS